MLNEILENEKLESLTFEGFTAFIVCKRNRKFPEYQFYNP